MKLRSTSLWIHGRICALVALLAFSDPILAQMTLLSIKALDQHGRVLEGIRFAFGGVESLPTVAGVTTLSNPSLAPGKGIKLDLHPDLSEIWLLIDSTVHAPLGAQEGAAEVVLVLRSELRKLAGEARDEVGRAHQPGQVITEGMRREILIDYAAQHGLSEDELAQAIAAFGDTEDPMDRGIAAYLTGEYVGAEAVLREAAEAQEGDFPETLRYLGAAQYAQGKYEAAAATFRKAVGLKPDDGRLLSGLGNTLHEAAAWEEAEQVLRHALTIALRDHGDEDPRIATALNNLAQLLHATNRLAEAEPLMRRALAIDESSYGPDHPTVAIRLNNLAALLKATNRLAEAEPLMRRALAIDESSFGPDHPRVATGLNNLAQLLQATNRLAAAEPLLRRALAIDEASYGPDHPEVARDLNNLAQLLKATGRLAEAEPLMRRALAIAESSLGPNHPNTIILRSNLLALIAAIEAEELSDDD